MKEQTAAEYIQGEITRCDTKRHRLQRALTELDEEQDKGEIKTLLVARAYLNGYIDALIAVGAHLA